MKVVSQLSDTAVCGLQTDGSFDCEGLRKEILHGATAQAHDKWHEEHFAEELQRAFEAGKRMAEYALRVANV